MQTPTNRILIGVLKYDFVEIPNSFGAAEGYAIT